MSPEEDLATAPWLFAVSQAAAPEPELVFTAPALPYELDLQPPAAALPVVGL